MTSLNNIEYLGNQPIVIDNGSGIIKAGFAGKDIPRSIFPSYIGTTKHPRIMPGGALDIGDTSFVGKKVENHRGLFKIHYAMQHGIVTNWSHMQKIWEYIYSKDMMNISSEEHPVLLTEAPLNPSSNRMKASEILFEHFNVPALFVSPQAVLSLYASGRTTGVVLDSGDGVTHVVPVYESYILPHAITRMDLAGRDITNYLQLLLQRSGYKFHTSAEFEVVKEIKERLCYVAYDPIKEEETIKKIYNNMTGANTLNEQQPYLLPDGTPLTIGAESFRAPEVLFRPEILGLEYEGIHDCLLKSILKADLDLRKILFSQIVLAGGTTMFNGFGDRLLHELREKGPKNIKIRITAPPNRNLSTWTGGSILASLATFKTMWITKSEYEEYGPNIILKKTI